MSKKRQLLEKEIVGSILVNNKRIPEVAQQLAVEDFNFFPNHYRIIVDSWQKNQNIHNELLASGLTATDLADLMDTFPSRSLDFAAKELKQQSTAQKIKSILTQASEDVPTEEIDDFVADLQQRIIQSTSEYSAEPADASSLVDEFRAYQEIYREKRRNGGVLLGLSTGYSNLDELIDGLRPEHLWVIGGYSSMGKTFAALNIVAHLMKNKHRTVFYSLEMSRVDIVSRIIGILTHQNGSSVAKGYVDEGEVESATKLLLESNLSVFNEKHDISQILLSMYEEHLRNPVSLFVVDFLQLVKVKNARSEYETTTQAILELQKAAKRFGVPIIVLSQVSNESVRASGDTLLMGFKGSGGIAAAADLAIELTSGEDSIKTYREKLNQGEPVWLKWQIRKNRHGRVGFLGMEFTSKTGVFRQLMGGEEQQPPAKKDDGEW